MNQLEINLNDSAEVVLTASGADIYNNYYADFRFYRPELKHEKDILRQPLWSLFQVFGEHLGLGGFSPFKHGKIKLEVKN